MQCKKCRKEIPEGSLFCCFCGKKQEVTRRKRARRAHSTGTVRFRQDCRKRPYLAYAPATSNGAGRRYLGAYPTMAAAQQTLERYAQGSLPELERVTVGRIYEMWSEKHFPTLSPSGVQSYKTAWKWLEPVRAMKMSEVKTTDLQACIDGCAEKFSRAQCEKVKQLCSQLCRFAMQNDIISKNYAEFVRLPKSEQKEKQIFTDEQIELFWAHSTDERVQCILIMIYTGFRIGEICNILRENVDPDCAYIVAGEKTEAGINRFVPVCEEIRPFVRQLYSRGGERLIEMAVKKYRNDVFYAALADLGLIEPPVYNPKTKKHEYKDPAYTPHCTRHTFASLCVRAGMKPEYLKEIIGHAKYETTADIYVHENREALLGAMAVLKREITEPIAEPITAKCG